MAELGYIGLGVMGRGIVERLLAAGHTVTVWNRTPEKAEQLLERGARWADSPREVATQSDIVFTMVTNTAAVQAVCEGPDGLLAGLGPGKVYVDMSTASPANARALAAQVSERGALMLDAPVSGSVITLEQGKLSIMVGGDAEAFERVKPVLEAIGPKVFHLGPNGSAVTMKIASNLSLAVQMLAFSEGVLLAEKSGIPRERAVEVLLASVIASPMVTYRGPFVLGQPDEAWFDCHMMQKDMNLALELGRRARGAAADDRRDQRAPHRRERDGYRRQGLLRSCSTSWRRWPAFPRRRARGSTKDGSRWEFRTYGTMQVDWEQRADLERLRRERLARAQAGLETVGARRPALLRHEQHPLHHGDSHRHVGGRQVRALLPAAAGRRPDHVGLRLRRPPPQDLQPLARGRSLPRRHLDPARLSSRPRRGGGREDPGRARAAWAARRALGVDIVELPVLRALEAAGITVVDGQALMQDVRMVKTQDEITLLGTACAMVDAAYDNAVEGDGAGDARERVRRARQQDLFELGSEHIEGINAISGERCSPHPHVFTDRMLRPGDPAYFDILHAYNGYRTCYYRTFAVGSASRALVDAYKRSRDILDRAIALIRPGVSTADVVEVFPKAQEFGFPDEEAAFALQYGHGVGLSSWEKPIFSRLVSFDYPGDDRGRDGLRARDVLARVRRLAGGAHRGAARRHEATGAR